MNTDCSQVERVGIMKETTILKVIGTNHIEYFVSVSAEMIPAIRAAAAVRDDVVLHEITREDFERPFFCAKRALVHIRPPMEHPFAPLSCVGCEEAALFITEAGYRGDRHPVGVDGDRDY